MKLYIITLLFVENIGFKVQLIALDTGIIENFILMGVELRIM